MLFNEKRLNELVSLYRGSMDATECTVALIAQDLLEASKDGREQAFHRGVEAGAEYVIRCLPLLDRAIVPELRKNLPLIVDTKKPVDENLAPVVPLRKS